MKNAKATLVTIIIAVMLAIIDAGMFLLLKTGFFICTGIFAVIGFVSFFLFFRIWLTSGKTVENAVLPIVIGEPVSTPKKESKQEEKPAPETDSKEIPENEVIAQTVDSIMQEYREPCEFGESVEQSLKT